MPPKGGDGFAASPSSLTTLGRADIPECRGRSREAAHSVHAAAGWSRRRAEVETFERRAVRDEPARGAEEQLSKIHQAAVDVAAHNVAVAPLEVGRPDCAPRKDEVAEARREALDLRLDPVGHVLG